MQSRRNRFSSLFILLALCSPFFASSGIPLPRGEAIPGWEPQGPQLRFIPSTLFNYINGGAEIFNEFGFQELTVQNYQKNGQEITVELYRMDGAPAALGLFYRQGGQNQGLPSDPVHLARSPYQWTLSQGAWFVQINAPANSRNLEREMEAFAADIKAQITPETVHLFDILPTEGRISGSEFLVRGLYGMQPVFTFGEGDILQLAGRRFAIGAEYQDSGALRFTRLIIPYEGENQAAEVFASLKGNLDPYLEILRQDDTRIRFRDFSKKYGVIRLDGQRLDILLHLSRQPD